MQGRKDSSSDSVVDDGEGHLWLVRPVAGKAEDFGVLAIDLGQQAGAKADAIRQRVDTVLDDATATLEHLDLGQAISEARVRSETEALRDALIGSVSHQLRTPLVSILGAATVISRAPGNSGDPRLASLADILRDEVDRLNSDVQDLLDAALISSKGVRLESEWVEPADIVNTAIDRRQRLLAGHRVALDIPSELPFIYVDPILLEQALGQIVDNAAKYSQPGSAITRCCEKRQRLGRAVGQGRGPRSGGRGTHAPLGTLLPRRTARIECVRIGSRALDRESLRDRERRRDRSVQRRRRPRYDRVNSPAGKRSPEAGPRWWATMSSATILVIDDELHIRQFLRAAFEFEGFAVQEASDAEEGIRSATLKPPDLIILDLGLPDRDGSSVIERLRSWSNIPIIVLTVRSREREKVRLLELGADDYVVKPFGIGELIARARAALRPRVGHTARRSCRQSRTA